jgi:hypothetical protein
MFRDGGTLMLKIGNELKSLHELIKLQNIYIQQILPFIYHLAADSALITNHHFQKFAANFLEFMRYHYNAEGCCQTGLLALSYQQLLLEKILDIQILTAAEKMELAIEYLEEAAKSIPLQLQPQIIVLNQNMLLLEETQLRIIEKVEGILNANKLTVSFQN